MMDKTTPKTYFTHSLSQNSSVSGQTAHPLIFSLLVTKMESQPCLGADDTCDIPSTEPGFRNISWGCLWGVREPVWGPRTPCQPLTNQPLCCCRRGNAAEPPAGVLPAAGPARL